MQNIMKCPVFTMQDNCVDLLLQLLGHNGISRVTTNFVFPFLCFVCMTALDCVKSNRGLHYAPREVVWLTEVLSAAQHDIMGSALAACSPAKGLPFVADAKRG
jgi:hypothetical protein